MEVPGLGQVTLDSEFGWYYSESISIPMFDGKQCRIVLEGYDGDPRKDEFHDAIANFLAASRNVLREVEGELFRYYKDYETYWLEKGNAPLHPADVWKHIHLGSEPMVSRRHYGNKGIYISLECGCDWEEEHGLQIVFKNGSKVNKLGQYDGHLTNSDAFDDEALENVIYVGSDMLNYLFAKKHQPNNRP